MRINYVVQGALWLTLYLILALAPLLIVLVGAAQPKREFIREASVALGFVGLAMMGLQFILTARFKWLKAPYGSDIVYSFHRQISLIAFGFILAHPLLLTLVDLPAVLIRFDFINHPFYPRFGFYAALAVTILVGASLFRRPLRIGYDGWRRLHGVLASLAILCGVVHVFEINHYLQTPWKRFFWLGYTLMWLSLTLWVRLIKPWLELGTPYVVEGLRPERGDAHTLAVAPLGHPGIRFQPGQFAWVTVGDSPFSDREHPFSFSGSAERAPGRLEFTIKALGDFTRRIREVQVGQRVYVDGPFGVLSADRHVRAYGFVFIAGGIGITPMMSHLRTLADRGDRRPLVLIYGGQDYDGLTFREEIDVLAARLRLKVVYVLANPPVGWTGEKGLLSQELLGRHMPRDGRYEYLICGPPTMMDAVERSLRRLGIPIGDYHSERFDLA
ncbi:MAG: ferric reductase-like transmembrane domain-containing protein [Phycisphaerae bacterium]|nr:ferric reductase-like transmembrane domain-containing protein [Phycisphaerae bacterium]